MGNFRPQPDHSAAGAPLSHRCFRTDDILDDGQVDSVFLGGSPMGDAASLVFVLSAHAVHPASGGVHRSVVGKAGKFPPAEMDSASLHTHRCTFAAGADQ